MYLMTVSSASRFSCSIIDPCLLGKNHEGLSKIQSRYTSIVGNRVQSKTKNSNNEKEIGLEINGTKFATAMSVR